MRILTIASQKGGAGKTTLAAHHRYYLHGKEPWEYPQDAFVMLCERCHQQETQERREAERRLLFALRAAGFYANDVREIADAFDRVLTMSGDNTIFVHLMVDLIGQVLSDPFRFWPIPSEMGTNKRRSHRP